MSCSSMGSKEEPIPGKSERGSDLADPPAVLLPRSCLGVGATTVPKVWDISVPFSNHQLVPLDSPTPGPVSRSGGIFWIAAIAAQICSNPQFI